MKRLQTFLLMMAISLFATISGAFAQSTDTATVNLRVTLTETAPFVDISTATFNLGSIDIPPYLGTSYFGAGGLEVTWKAPNGSNFHINIKTDNAANADGIVDNVIDPGANSIPLRFNNPNLGIPGDVNNPTVIEWETIYGFVKDADNLPVIEFADESLGYSRVAGDNFNLNFAVEVLSTVIAGSYSAPVTLDLVLE